MQVACGPWTEWKGKMRVAHQLASLFTSWSQMQHDHRPGALANMASLTRWTVPSDCEPEFNGPSLSCFRQMFCHSCKGNVPLLSTVGFQFLSCILHQAVSQGFSLGYCLDLPDVRNLSQTKLFSSYGTQTQAFLTSSWSWTNTHPCLEERSVESFLLPALTCVG